MNNNYCKFQNTAIDLEHCLDTFGDADLSQEEFNAREEILRLCNQIIEEFQYLENEEFHDPQEEEED